MYLAQSFFYWHLASVDQPFDIWKKCLAGPARILNLNIYAASCIRGQVSIPLLIFNKKRE